MSNKKKSTKQVLGSNKNTVGDSEIYSGGNTNIGDQTTINVYGHEANQKDLEFFIKVYVILIFIFGIAALGFLVIPKQPEIFPNDYIASFAAGGFFVLASLFLLLLYRSKHNALENLNRLNQNDISN